MWEAIAVFSILIILGHFRVRRTVIRRGAVENPLEHCEAALRNQPTLTRAKHNLPVVDCCQIYCGERLGFSTYHYLHSTQWLLRHPSEDDHVFSTASLFTRKKKMCEDPYQLTRDAFLAHRHKAQYLIIAEAHVRTCGPSCAVQLWLQYADQLDFVQTQQEIQWPAG